MFNYERWLLLEWFGSGSKFYVVESKVWNSEEYIYKKTHIASALAVRCGTTELGLSNNIAVSAGILCVGDGSEIHKVKSWNDTGSCEMEQVVRLLIDKTNTNYFKP
jgi:hypothetical protein